MKSLPNMIKAYTVRYDEQIIKTIDTHLRIDREIETQKKLLNPVTEPSSEFIEGLKALVIDIPPSEEETTEKTSKILEDANCEAKNIIAQAKKDAEQIKNDAIVSGQKKGYDEGIQQGKKEIQKTKSEYEEKTRQLRKEYESMAIALEPQMAEIIASLVEKITGIIVGDREEVILYLVDKALKKMDKSDEYTIKVSKDDYEYISMRKNLLLGAIGREVPLYITEDSNLRKNQCLIETELRVINCSLDVQLNNLLTDLKLISGI